MRTTKAGAGRTIAAGSGAQRGPWQSFDVSDGLPASSIVAIVQDANGDLWLGGAMGGGVCRYDGTEFTIFSAADGLPGSSVLAILEDGEGCLWFGTGRGACRYDGDEYTTYAAEDGLAGGSVFAVVQDNDGALWFGADGGVSRFDGRDFVSYAAGDGLADGSVVCILEDRQGNLWFGTWGGGVSCFDGESFTTYTTADGLAHDVVRAMWEDRQRRIWLGTGGHVIGNVGLSCYEDGAFATYTTEDGLTSNNVGAMYEDGEGRLWLGTYGGGVCRYDDRRDVGERFTCFTTADGLADNTVTEIAEDNEGNLWFGTGSPNAAGGGVSRYAGLQFDVFAQRDGLVSDNVMSLCEDREGRVWMGTWKGVSRFLEDELTAFLDDAELNVWSIAEDRRGYLWFGGYPGGVRRYDGQEIVAYTCGSGSADTRVSTIVEDGKGRLWFGTTGGVWYYDGGDSLSRFAAIDELVDTEVLAICADRLGRLWFATRDRVYRYDREGHASFGADDGRAPRHVVDILEDRQGDIWFASAGGGVSRFDGEQSVTYTTADGLPHNHVTSLMEDREGHLWFSTYGGGVSRYDGLVFQNLHRRNSLPHSGVRQVLQDRRGDYWIATDGGGVVRYRSTCTPPAVRIVNTVADREYGGVERIDLSVSQRLVAFEYSGRSFKTGKEQLAYVYRLQGRDSEWQSTRDRRMSYQDLELGEYVFEVKAVDRDLNYSPPATVQVNVVPDPKLQAWREALSSSGMADEFVGQSAALQRAQARLAQVAPTDLTVLILGETGTGKGLAAHALHGLSSRASGPLVTINCGAIPEGLVESELFGHERGAFTGAVRRKIGKVELAEGGTLFLDEIGDLAPAAQVKLLHLIEEKAFERVGGTATIRVDVRLIAATNRDLEQMVEERQLREDLYFRLQPFPVQLPPLRERRDDIPLLAAYFAEGMATHLHKEVTELAPEAVEALQRYQWPGNVRELEHVVQQAVITCRGPAILAEDIVLGPESSSRDGGKRLTPEEYERQYLREALEQTEWVIKGTKGAAQMLGMSASTLRYRMKKLKVERD